MHMGFFCFCFCFKLKLSDGFIVCHPVNFNLLTVAMEGLETVKTDLWKITIIANLNALETYDWAKQNIIIHVYLKKENENNRSSFPGCP